MNLVPTKIAQWFFYASCILWLYFSFLISLSVFEIVTPTIFGVFIELFTIPALLALASIFFASLWMWFQEKWRIKSYAFSTFLLSLLLIIGLILATVYDI